MYRDAKQFKRALLLATLNYGQVECPCCEGLGCGECNNGVMPLNDALKQPAYLSVSAKDRQAYRQYEAGPV